MSAATGISPRPGSEEWARLTDPFRAELLAHCYRMLGSVHDAEDQVQETLLRAWRMPEVPWLSPIPDVLSRSDAADPASVTMSRANIRLALVAALQYLPPRQRAVLILRDVLGWRAAEVAELLGTTTTAANSALRRARAQLQHLAPSADDIREPADPGDREVLNRYARAFEDADAAAVAELLRDDAVFEMPPVPTWFSGRDRIGLFLRSHVLRVPGAFTMIPTAANGQPALAVYQRGEDGARRFYGIQVLTLSQSRVTRIVTFLDSALFAIFGFPPELPAGIQSAHDGGAIHDEPHPIPAL